VAGGLPIAVAFLLLLANATTSSMIVQSHCRAALASLDFFASVFYQEKIEGLAGEAKDRLK